MKMQMLILMAGFVLTAAAPAGQETAKDGLTVTAVRVTETRVKTLEESATDDDSPGSFAFMGQDPGTTIRVRVEGEAVRNASSYGRIRIEAAVDDAGTDLKPEAKKRGWFSGGDDEGWEAIASEGMFGKGEATEKGFAFDLSLGLAARKASAIRQVKGSLQVLAGGEDRTVTVAKPKSKIGQAVTDANLDAAKLTMQLVDPTRNKSFFSSGGANSLTVEFKGDLNALADVDILDASGESYTTSSMWSDGADQRTYSYDLKGPLNDEVSVKVHLRVGLKRVDVPFSLTNIALP